MKSIENILDDMRRYLSHKLFVRKMNIIVFAIIGKRIAEWRRMQED